MIFEALSFATYEKLIEKIAKDLHDKTINPEDLNQEFITQTFNDLSESAADGYGSKWNKFPKDGKGNTPLFLKRNIYAFSGAKSYAILEELNNLLVDSDGKIRPFNEFMPLAKKVNENFNKNYLQAEYQTAKTAAQMAEKWERLQETKDLFPNLKFRTVGDSRVRREHEKLDGIIIPIDDEFWNRFYPPLDWRCRCDVVATAEDADEKIPDDLPTVKFKGNVGKDKEIYTKKGTFFQLLNTNENAVRNAELSKLIAPFESKRTPKNNEIFINIFADRSMINNEFKNNVECGELIRDVLKFKVELPAHLDGKIIKNRPNAEYRIKGKIADRKSPEGNRLSNQLRKAQKQECEIIVYDLINYLFDMDTLLKKLKSSFEKDEHYPSIQEFIIISKDRKTIKHYTRSEIKKGIPKDA